MRDYMSNPTSRQGLDRMPGVNLLKSGVRTVAVRPRGEKGRTVFRIFPYVDAKGVERPMRLEPELLREKMGQNAPPTVDNAFYPFIAAEEMVGYGGTQNAKFTCFARVRDKDPRFAGPIKRFFSNMYSALKNNSNAFPRDWAAWIGNRGALPRIDTVGLVQGILYENGGKPPQLANGQSGPQHPAMLIIPKSAREELEKLCNLRNPGSQPDDTDFDRVFPYNQLVSSAKGSLVSFTFFPSSNVTKQIAHYEVKAETPLPLDPRLAQQEFVDWDNLLYFMDEKEQMDTLVGNFPAEAIDYVFGQSEYVDLLPKTVVGRWSAFLRGGAVFAPPPNTQQQYPQQQAPYAPQPGYLPPAPQPPAPQAASGQYAAPAPAAYAAPAPAAYAAPQPNFAPPTPAAPTAPVPFEDTQPVVPGQPAAYSQPLPPAPAPAAYAAPAAPSAPVAPMAPPIPRPVDPVYNPPAGTPGYPPGYAPQSSAAPAAPLPQAPAPGPVAMTPPVLPAEFRQPPAPPAPQAAAPAAPIGDPTLDRSHQGDVRSRLLAAAKMTAEASQPNPR